MGKKGRRQDDPPGAEETAIGDKKEGNRPSPMDNVEPSDSSEDNKADCPHVKKFKNKCTKSFKKDIHAVCKECNESKSKADVEGTTAEADEQDKANEVDLLMCLFCGHVGCQKHANSHIKVQHSDCHDFAFEMKKDTIWCLQCQKKVQTSHLGTVMKCWQKKIEVPKYKINGASDVDNKNINVSTPFLNKEVCKSNKKQPLVKGLINLGNTCFFNSVVQCLAQTPYLVHVLERLDLPDESCCIPGKKEDKLEPLNGTLLPITSPDLGKNYKLIAIPLLNQLKRMRSRESNNVERPEELLSSLKTRYEQFKGREQHDAHELLRHLLEGVRMDDLKRFQKVILENKYVGKHGIDDNTRKDIRTYGFKANDLPLGPDILFRGELISTLVCQDCSSSSTRTEYFLDLSLPVTEEKPQPPNRKKDIEYNTGPSKQQLKKEKKEKRRAEKKAAKQSRNEKQAAALNQDPVASDDESDNSDADVEDNEEPDTSLAENRLVSRDSVNVVGSADASESADVAESADVIESGYSSEKAQNGDSAESVSPAESGCADGELSLSLEVEPGALPPVFDALIGFANTSEVDPPPPQPFTIDEDDAAALSAAPSTLPLTAPDVPSTVPLEAPSTLPLTAPAAPSTLPLINEIAASPTPSPSPESPSKGSEEDVFDFQQPCNVPAQDCDRGDVAANDCADNDPASDMLKCSPSEGDDGGNGARSPLDVSDLQKRLSSLQCAENGLSDGSGQSDRGGSGKNGPKNVRSSPTWTETLAPRTAVSEGECSVLSCLNQFTALELMHTTNKVGCDECTKNKSKDGKTVLTNSTKQLLISAPPAILIIHLKRFIADISRLKKMNRHVTFPMTLDLAPFCSRRCRELKTVKPKQTEILYNLYGVVEHSGQMGGGHYVAYVKVRMALGDQDPRWNFLAPGREFLETRPTREDGAGPAPMTSAEEQWYYISDSHVSAVGEEKVKGAQAYVLFYERVV